MSSNEEFVESSLVPTGHAGLLTLVGAAVLVPTLLVVGWSAFEIWPGLAAVLIILLLDGE